LRIDRARRDLGFRTTLGQRDVLGLGTLSDQIRHLPPGVGQPLAAINGDFFHLEQEPYSGTPVGALVLAGELVSPPDGKGCFWIDAEGQPHLGTPVSRLKVTWPSGERIPCGLNQVRKLNGAVLYTPRVGESTETRGGREFILERAGQNPWLPFMIGQTYKARVREVRATGDSRLSADTVVLSLGPLLDPRMPKLTAGSELTISLATSPDLKGAQTVLGGGPLLVRAGSPQASFDHKSFQRHPRAALGWNEKYFFLVAVDGRQRGLSVGMTLDELAEYMTKLGCQEAMNLDGGASVELWVEGRIVNSPCFGRERRTGNSLVLLKTDGAAREATNRSVSAPASSE
jgi:hypothetical protein